MKWLNNLALNIHKFVKKYTFFSATFSIWSRFRCVQNVKRCLCHSECTHTIWIGKWYKRRHINSITIPEIHPELYASSLLLVILPLNSLALHTYLIWKKNNNNTKNRNDSKQNEPTFATFNIYVHFVRLQMLNKTARYDLMSAFVWNWNFLLNSLLYHPHFNPLSHSILKYIDMYVCMYVY